MSNQFKYEIDERRLRLRLKENELSFNEEAWQKFESFSSVDSGLGAEVLVQRFRVSMNRNVVLPVVFASVIILFSLLLFNFINIKDSSGESANAIPASAESLPPEEPVKQTVSAVVPEPEPKKETASVPVEATETKTEERKQEPTPPREESSRKAVAQESSETKPAEVRPDSNSSVNSVTEYTPAIKKRRRKVEPVVTEPTQEEADQTPPPAEAQP